MLPWIKLAVGLPRHPKALDLADALGEPMAWAHMVALWLWAAEYAPDGQVESAHIERTIERAAEWRGEPGRFCSAAIEAGLLERTPTGACIHDWEEHQGAHARQAALDAGRARKHRASRSRHGRVTVPGVTGVTGQRDGRDATVTRHGAGRDESRVQIEIEIENKQQIPCAAHTATVSGQSVADVQPLASSPPQPEHEPSSSGPALGEDAVTPPTQPARPTARRAQRARGPTHPGGHAEVMAHWCAAWQRVSLGGHYVVTGADGAGLARLLRAGIEPAEICARMDRALADPWFRAHCADLRGFAGQANRWALAVAPEPRRIAGDVVASTGPPVETWRPCARCGEVAPPVAYRDGPAPDGETCLSCRHTPAREVSCAPV